MRFENVVLRVAALSSLLLTSGFIWAQQSAARITRPVDDNRVQRLSGNTHPLARPELDAGAAPETLPIRRMMLLLSRSPERQAALDKLVEEQHTQGSPNYRHWLTPEEVGRDFGPAEADVQVVTAWLQRQGFSVGRVTASRTVIEFSGSVGQVRNSFHTGIRKYVVNGKEHWANSQDPTIPEALAPVVKGVVSLNNFPRKPLSRRFGAFSRDRNGVVTPNFTTVGGSGNYYALAPADFATIYNTKPLLEAGTNGAGQTIALIGRTNINLQDVTDFRNLFSLGVGNTSVVVDGDDPGIVLDDEFESLLDVEWASAAAPGASVVLVTAQDTESSSGLDLAALHAIETNVAGVISESYGTCEAYLGTAGNAFYQALWQQAATQGITVLVSTGDNGSAGCDSQNEAHLAEHGVGVNGIASTAYNVAVGGTDFDDVGTQPTYWNTTNDSVTRGSAKSYIPESTWNETCAPSATPGNLNVCPTMPNNGTPPDSLNLWAGSGGASSCTVATVSGGSILCQNGRAKPSWQTGPGVPSDGVRDLPDVSLFSAVNSSSNSFYVVCGANLLPGYPSCKPSSGSIYFIGAGGTSAAAPSFAGVIALAQQKAGTRLGNVNYLLYSIAAGAGASCTSSASSASSCVFHDVIKGNISVPCKAGSPNCSATSGTSTGVVVGNGEPAYSAAAGYDLATGLGSVNAANLVTSINSALAKYTPTATALVLNGATTQITAKHGEAINIGVSVNPAASSGQVSLVGDRGGIEQAPLTSGMATWTSKLFPGGNYSVKAHYAGDGTYGASDSNSIPVSISAESSKTYVNLVSFDRNFGTNFAASSVPYGSNYLLRMDVGDASSTLSATTGVSSTCSTGNASCPTGRLTLTSNGSPLDIGVFSLNSAGYSEDQQIQLSAGSYTLSASYSGDTSYSASSGSSVVNITKASTTLQSATSSGPPYEYGAMFEIVAQLRTTSSGIAPSGNVTFLDNGASADSSVKKNYLSTFGGDQYGPARFTYSGTYSAASLGTHTLYAQYSGDSNYSAADSGTFSFTVGKASMSLSSYGVVPNSATPTIPLTFSATITTSSSREQPTGTVTFNVDGTPIDGTVTYGGHPGSWGNPYGGNYVAALTATLTAKVSEIGTRNITVSYSGDERYKPFTSSIGTLIISDKLPTTMPQIGSTLSPALRNYPTTLTSSVGIPQTHSLPTPTGTITFSDNGQPLTGTVSYQTTFTGYGSYTLTASLPYTFTTSGAHNISASYSGDSTYSPSTSAMPLTLNVLDKALTTIPYINASNTLANSPASLSFNVNSDLINVGPNMTGTVTILDGSTALTDDVQIQQMSGYIIGYLTHTFTTVGTHNITVKYSGDDKYQASQSQAFSVQVMGPIAVRLFSNEVQSSGGVGSAYVDVLNNTTDTMAVNVACTPDSSSASCSLDRTNISIPPWTATLVTVNYSVPALSAAKSPRRGLPFTIPVAFAGVLCASCVTTRRRRVLLWTILAIGTVVGFASCGGGGGGGNSGGITPPPTSRTYHFTIKATSGLQTDSQVLTVNVR